MIVIGASAYPRIIDFVPFRQIADETGAMLMADIAHVAGLVAVGLHPNPVPYCEFVTTTTHKTLRGPRAGIILCREEMAKKLNSSIFPGTQGGPLMHVIAAKAVALKEAMTPEFKEYQAQIVRNTRAMAGAIARRGFRLVSGGTDTHLFLVNLKDTPLTGKDAQEALDRVGITVNKNTVPFETRSPFVTSGIRAGTPAITTRGMKEREMERIGNMIADILSAPGDTAVERRVMAAVRDLCEAFPLYPGLLADYAKG
jgi:glycine hydroxymethyltransferase